MNLTNKQKAEIDFLCKNYKVNPSDFEIEQYIQVSVHGKGKQNTGGLSGESTNKLLDTKRRLDMNIKMWREDLTVGLLGAEELKSDFNCEYGDKLVDSILKSVNKDFRLKTLTGNKLATHLSFTNFPEVMSIFKEKLK